MNTYEAMMKGPANLLLRISWHDSQWIPILNPSNILDYFSERSNPFYDKTCNNEIIKMQRLNPSHLINMEGIEYILLHVQEPILYVIRKQHRHGTGQVTPLADYYCIAGIIYQAPDLGSVVNSRLMNTINNLQSAFNECLSYTRYHPSKGYSWDFGSKDVIDEKNAKKAEKVKDEPSSIFQRQRVDMLLVELSKKFPPRAAANPPQPVSQPQQQGLSQQATDGSLVPPTAPKQLAPGLDEIKSEGKENALAVIKQENMDSTNIQQQRMKPPPEKKPRLM